MIEMVILCCYTIPLGIWLSVTILQAGLSRDPMAFSVIEMLFFLISAVLVASCVYLVRQYKTTKNEGNGYSMLYGLLISSGSVLTALLVALQFYGTGMMPNAIKVILGVHFYALYRCFKGLAEVEASPCLSAMI